MRNQKHLTWILTMALLAMTAGAAFAQDEGEAAPAEAPELAPLPAGAAEDDLSEAEGEGNQPGEGEDGEVADGPGGLFNSPAIRCIAGSTK